MGARVQSFEELDVYRLALRLQQEIFEVTKTFPPEERYSLTDQVRRSSRSVGGNIAEAWHKRLYPAHFKSKLTDADGEQGETRHWVKTAFLCGYIAETQNADWLSSCCRIGRMLGRMMAEPEKWQPRP